MHECVCVCMCGNVCVYARAGACLSVFPFTRVCVYMRLCANVCAHVCSACTQERGGGCRLWAQVHGVSLYGAWVGPWGFGHG